MLTLFIYRAPCTLWRTVWRIVAAFHLFGRFDDVSRLTPSDLSFPETPRPHMTVRLIGGKTDNLNRGFVRYVSCNSQNPRYCPVQLTLDYLAFLGPGYSGYLVARSQTAPNRKLCLDGRHRLSYANALRNFRFLLQALGYDPKEYAEHSPKRGAATAASEAGIDEAAMSHFAGWSTRTMPALYTDWPPARYLAVSDQLQS